MRSRLRLGIRERRAAADERLGDARGAHDRVLVHLPDYREGKALDMRMQRAHVLTQPTTRPYKAMDGHGRSRKVTECHGKSWKDELASSPNLPRGSGGGAQRVLRGCSEETQVTIWWSSDGNLMVIGWSDGGHMPRRGCSGGRGVALGWSSDRPQMAIRGCSNAQIVLKCSDDPQMALRDAEAVHRSGSMLTRWSTR